jgi:iron complex transport system permease protein
MKSYRPIRVNKGKISYLLDKKALLTFIILAGITVVSIVISAGTGERMLSPVDVVKSILGLGTKFDQLVVQSLRMPRILIALLAGICLAAAGSILQGLIRNPLASPDVIGVTGGASVAVVLFILLFSTNSGTLTVNIAWQPVAAFAGAAITGVLVYVLSYKNGASTFRLVLIGIGMSMLAQSLTTLFMIKGPIHRAQQANIWITGSVYGSSWYEVSVLFSAAVVLLLLSFLAVRHVNIQGLGEEVAKGAGSKVQLHRFYLLLLSTALTASAVSFAGTIGFVGLIAPHIARRLVGSSFGALLPSASLLGGLLVVFADLIGRIAFAPLEIPAGVFTAAIGAPYFIYLLYKTRNQ